MLRILPVGERPSLSMTLSRISACRHREVSENGRVCANVVVRRRVERIDENNMVLVMQAAERRRSQVALQQKNLMTSARVRSPPNSS